MNTTYIPKSCYYNLVILNLQYLDLCKVNKIYWPWIKMYMASNTLIQLWKRWCKAKKHYGIWNQSRSTMCLYADLPENLTFYAIYLELVRWLSDSATYKAVWLQRKIWQFLHITYTFLNGQSSIWSVYFHDPFLNNNVSKIMFYWTELQRGLCVLNKTCHPTG